jgi:predicted RNA-binding Zn-ribbon protein involved in translation (DUF1610 family)
MDSAHTVRLKCPRCGQPGLAHWAHPESGRAGPRRLIALTAGFAAIGGAHQREPEVLCTTCEEIPPGSSAHSFALAD